MAAHEHLLSQTASKPHHLSLYLALFRQWNLERFPEAIQIDRRELMQAARIGSRDTYTAALRDLDAWGLLNYRPNHDSTKGTRILMVEMGGQVSPKVGQPSPVGMPESGPTSVGEVGPNPGQPVSPKVGQHSPEVGPNPGQPSLLYKTKDLNSTTNGGSGTKKKIGEVFSGEGFSEVQVLDDTASFDEPVPTPGAAPKKKVAPKKKGVGQGPQAATIRATATAARAEPRRRGGRPQRPELPFTESELATPEAFAAAFEGTDYALADLRYYHALVGNWRKDGEPPLRRDWKATATKFMLNDAADNRLKLAPGTQRHEPGAGGSDTGTRPAGSGYRSKYDA